MISFVILVLLCVIILKIKEWNKRDLKIFSSY